MDRRCLVAGGAGFLGLHLCRRLLEQGHHVICMDDLSTSQIEPLQPLLRAYPRLVFMRHDVTLPLRADQREVLGKVDVIFNLACPASPVHYQFDPIQTTKTSCLGAINLLELAQQHHARIFQASTSEVYGDPDVVPQSESYWGHVNCTGVRACYDEGKRVAETLFLEYHRTRNVDVRIARIFNTYGPGMHPYDGRVVSNFIMQALCNEDVTIYGDGQQTRSFCFVDDLMDAIVRFMECTTCAGPMNLGNPQETTVGELAALIVRLTESKSRVIFKDLPLDDPHRRQPDIALATRHLDWKPKIVIEDGLRRTIDYFRTLDLATYQRPTNHTAHTNSIRMKRAEHEGSSSTHQEGPIDLQ